MTSKKPKPKKPSKPKKPWPQIRIRPGSDPYIDWALGPGKPYYLGTEDRSVFVSVLLRLDGLSAQEFQDYFDCRQDQTPKLPTVLVPPVYLSQNYGPEARYITATVSCNFFRFLAGEKDLRKRVRAAVLGPRHPDESINLQPAEVDEILPMGALEDGTVVIGVIDDGIAFANERFSADVGGTRVNYAWLQGSNSSGGGSSLPYGRDWSKPQIDALIADCTDAGFLDEEKFYRKAGLIDFARQGHKAAAWRAAHGTFVLDLAAGFDPAENRHDRPIVTVQLPTSITADTSGTRLDRYVIDGIYYILQRADAIANQRGSGRLPVVINFSYGLIAGPHDGTGPLEAAIDEIIEHRSRDAPLAVSLPAGNSHLSRTHAQARFKKPAKSVSLSWRVQPDDRASSFMEIWLPYRPPAASPPSRIEVTLTPPNGPQSPALGEVDGTGFEWRPNGDPVAWIVYSEVPYPTERGRFFLALLPTFFLAPPTDLAPSGLWTVTLNNLTLEEADLVEAWIQRSDTPYGYPDAGRQSYFDEPCYVRSDVYGRPVVEDKDPPQPPCWVKRASLVNAIGTGRKPLLAGGFHRRELKAADYSAGGPISPTRGVPPSEKCRKPDALLVSDDSAVFTGVLAAGTRSNSIVNFDGTSVAAPQLARWAAERLAAGEDADRAAVKVEAEKQEGLLPSWKPDLPPKRGGWGRMWKIEGLPVVKPPR